MYEDFFHQRLTRLRMEKGVSARDMSLSLGQSAEPGQPERGIHQCIGKQQGVSFHADLFLHL